MGYILTASELAKMTIYGSKIYSKGLIEHLIDKLNKKFKEVGNKPMIAAKLHVSTIVFDKSGMFSDQSGIEGLAKIYEASTDEVAGELADELINCGISESMVTIKRRHTEKHPAIKAREQAIIRDKVVKFIGLDKVSRKDIQEFFNTLHEDEEVGRRPHISWIYKNTHLVKRVKTGKVVSYRLTRAGVNVFNKLEKDAS